MNLFHHQAVRLSRDGLTRRRFLHSISASALAAGTLSFRDVMSLQADELRKQGMSMILLFMQGGPSQFETFDPKPGTETGGPTKAISTAVPGIEVAEGWERTAEQMREIALLRSMTNKEGSHPRAVYQLHTGYAPTGTVKHPSLGACVAKEISPLNQDLPSVVSVGPTIGSGFLGVDYEPFIVNNPGQLPQNVGSPVSTPRFERRLGLLNKLEGDFSENGGEEVVANHKLLYEKTARLVLSPEVKAFDLSRESSDLRARYGDSQFGRGCLLARRLVEAGVTCVEVVLNGWDTHDNNFDRVKQLAGQADPAFAALVADLKDRGRLDKTLVVWTGEFGRTPRINPRTGRDHYPRVFNAAIAGGGVRGGQVIGSSTKDGMAIEKDPTNVADLFASICKSMQVNPAKENLSPLGRPLKIVDGGKVIEPLFGT
jgi:uncharacterized protein (DUF1501 family)